MSRHDLRGFYDLPEPIRQEGAQHMQNVLFGTGREFGILQHLLGGMGGLKLVPKAVPKGRPGMSEPASLSQTDLSGRVALGNRSAVDEAITRVQPFLRKFAGRYGTQSRRQGVGPTESAVGPGDLIQATNEALLKQLPGKSVTNLGGYVNRVAQSQMLREKRSGGAITVPSETQADMGMIGRFTESWKARTGHAPPDSVVARHLGQKFRNDHPDKTEYIRLLRDKKFGEIDKPLSISEPLAAQAKKTVGDVIPEFSDPTTKVAFEQAMGKLDSQTRSIMDAKSQEMSTKDIAKEMGLTSYQVEQAWMHGSNAIRKALGQSPKGFQSIVEPPKPKSLGAAAASGGPEVPSYNLRPELEFQAGMLRSDPIGGQPTPPARWQSVEEATRWAKELATQSVLAPSGRNLAKAGPQISDQLPLRPVEGHPDDWEKLRQVLIGLGFLQKRN